MAGKNKPAISDTAHVHGGSKLNVRDNSPRPYDLDNPDEVARLMRELEGYMRVSLHYSHGTDHEGRRFAYEALRSLNIKAKAKRAPVPVEG